MNRTQRVVLALYFLLVTYCCVWIPWQIKPEDSPPTRLNYGWLWAGPELDLGNERWSSAVYQRASPNLPIIALRLMAVTALGATAFTLGAIKR